MKLSSSEKWSDTHTHNGSLHLWAVNSHVSPCILYLEHDSPRFSSSAAKSVVVALVETQWGNSYITTVGRRRQYFYFYQRTAKWNLWVILLHKVKSNIHKSRISFWGNILHASTHHQHTCTDYSKWNSRYFSLHCCSHRWYRVRQTQIGSIITLPLVVGGSSQEDRHNQTFLNFRLRGEISQSACVWCVFACMLCVCLWMSVSLLPSGINFL